MDRPSKSELYALVLNSKGYYIDNQTDKHIKKFVKGRIKLLDGGRRYDKNNLGGVEMMRELRDIFVPGKMSEETYLKYTKEVLRNTIKYDFSKLNDEQKKEAVKQYQDILLLARGDATNNNQYPGSYGYCMKASLVFSRSPELQKLWEKASTHIKVQQIKDNYGNILDNKNRLAQIYGKIRKTENDTDVDVLIDSASDLRVKNKTSRKSIEETYKQINPELAALREEEREKVEKGMDPRQAQKERREAVKTYYNKKSQREM